MLTFFSSVLFVFLGVCVMVCNSLFMDLSQLYSQVEILEDCAIYVHVAVISTDNNWWCHQPKATINPQFSHKTYGSDSKDPRLVFFLIYPDNNDYLYVDFKGYETISAFDILSGQRRLFHRSLFEVWHVGDPVTIQKSSTHPGHNNAILPTFGRYYIMGFADHGADLYDTRNTKACTYIIEFDACDGNSISYTNRATYDCSNDKVTIEKGKKKHKRLSCGPGSTYMNYAFKKTQLEVVVIPDKDDKRIRNAVIRTREGSSSDTFVEFKMYSLKTSLQTYIVYRFDADKVLQLQYINEGDTVLNGANITTNPFEFNSKMYFMPDEWGKRKTAHFFLYMAEQNTYSPLLLSYKYTGPNRDYTVRFFYNTELHQIFDPEPYDEICKFENKDVTVAAAARVVSFNKDQIAIEVYFLLNNEEFRYCILDIVYTYSTHKADVQLSETSTTNAYVHLPIRTEYAVNCNYGNRTRRWLLACDNDGGLMQLINLNDGASTILFHIGYAQCQHITMMHCTMDPAIAAEYDTSVIITAENTNNCFDVPLANNRCTQAVMVGTKFDRSKVNLYVNITKTHSGRMLFLQNLSMALEPQSLYDYLQSGRIKDTDYVVKATEEILDDDYYEDFSIHNACSLVVIGLMTCFLFFIA